MHWLLSRAVRAQSSCRCRLCLHSGSSIVRHFTKVASRRKVLAADFFTACYTTILGTATVIDARRKEVRKKELDEKLEKARAALGNLGVHDSSSQQSEGVDSPDSGTVIISRSSDDGPRRKEQVAANSLLQELGVLYEITRRPVSRLSWIQTQLEWAHVEAAIVAEEQDSGSLLREPKSAQQLRRTTATVVELVNQLIYQSHTYKSTRSQDVDAKEQENSLDSADYKELKDILQTFHYPSYNQPTEDPGEAARIRFLLGESIRRIFNHATNTREIITKICYNLLTVGVPPSIHTYNTLIAGFNRIQCPDLAQTVVDSYIHRTTWPATEQTAVCLINHYRGINKEEGIRDIIQRMRGVRGDGLHFRIIDKKAIYTRDWLAWAIENCASRKYAYVERMRRTDAVFTSIIKGWLYCGELGNAGAAFVTCVRYGGSITIQTLQELFTACLSTVDYTAARRLVTGLAKNIRSFATWIDCTVHQESVNTSRQLIMSLLNLVDICRLPFNFAPVSESYIQTLQKLRSLINLTRLELEIEETANLCVATFEELTSSGSLVTRLDKALAMLDSAQLSRQKTARSLAHFGRLAELLSIERRCRDLETRIKSTTALTTATILKIKTGYEFDPSAILTSKQESPIWYRREYFFWYQRHRHDSLVNALQNIQISLGPMTIEDIRSQLLRRLPDPILSRRLGNSGHPENLGIRALTSFYASDMSHTNKHQDVDVFCSRLISQLEQEFVDIENTIRAILFAHLSGDTQRKLRFQYPDFYKMPFKKLYKYQLRRSIFKKVSAIDEQQSGGMKPPDQIKPATRASEGPLGIPRDIHISIEEGLHLDRSSTKLHSAGSSELCDADAALPLSVLG
ncbi:hypothetical protein F4813DRAFT_363530 [Daldinia decipiens]|uniref:uncharacterized protein n=1 Tax=Daldinia decipiens TaxID=326647 RepID=UPI0020C2CCB9|nr:uncharacterized protein F4813DRAFT_363530 [Daldinia decipiens]KAI1656533.1 hypothetical protein F4813DRAFT_363530 [Daldinia decipiens]